MEDVLYENLNPYVNQILEIHCYYVPPGMEVVIRRHEPPAAPVGAVFNLQFNNGNVGQPITIVPAMQVQPNAILDEFDEQLPLPMVAVSVSHSNSGEHNVPQPLIGPHDIYAVVSDSNSSISNGVLGDLDLDVPQLLPPPLIEQQPDVVADVAVADSGSSIGSGGDGLPAQNELQEPQIEQPPLLPPQAAPELHMPYRDLERAARMYNGHVAQLMHIGTYTFGENTYFELQEIHQLPNQAPKELVITAITQNELPGTHHVVPTSGAAISVSRAYEEGRPLYRVENVGFGRIWTSRYYNRRFLCRKVAKQYFVTGRVLARFHPHPLNVLTQFATEHCDPSEQCAGYIEQCALNIMFRQQLVRIMKGSDT
jgi:hypothetical protein